MEFTKVLMVIAVLAVIISGFNFIYMVAFKPSGYAFVDKGNVTLEIESMININFTNNLINWSTGYVNTSGPAPCVTGVEASLSTDPPNTVICGVSWQPQGQGLILESLSNQDINVSLNSNQNVTTLIEGDGNDFGSNFMWKVSNNEVGSCNTGYGPNPTTYTEIQQAQDVIICESMNWDDSKDALEIDFQVNISDQAAVQGYRTAVITATAVRSDEQVI